MSNARREIRILLVEDDCTNQEVALKALQHLGYGKAEVAADGKQALAALAARDFDLVLMDCYLPEMDGYETTRAIRAGASAVRNRDVPIVAFTAAAMHGDRRKCFAAGMNGYLVKPFRLKALEEVIDQWAGSVRPLSGPPAGSENAAPPGTPVFDRDEFAGSVMGSDDLARRIIRAFVDDIPRQIARLAQAVSDGDAPQVVQLAHSIKGAAACVSGQEMREVARQLEQSGRAGNLVRAGDGLRQLTASFTRAKTEMESFCEADADDS